MMKNKNRLKLEKSLLIIVIIFSLFLLNSCSGPKYMQVLDKETKEPISDVAVCYVIGIGSIMGGDYREYGIMFSDKKGRILVPSINIPLPMLSRIEMKIFPIGYKYTERAYTVIPDIFSDIYLEKIKTDKEYYNLIQTSTYYIQEVSWPTRDYTLIPIENRDRARNFIIKMCDDFLKRFPKSKYYNKVLYRKGAAYSDWIVPDYRSWGRDTRYIDPAEKIDYNKTAKIFTDILNNSPNYVDTPLIVNFLSQYEQYKKTGIRPHPPKSKLNRYR